LYAGSPRFKLGVVYVALDEVSRAVDTSDFANREEALLNLSSRLTENWQATGSIRRDLTGGGRTIAEAVGVTYENECIVISVLGLRRLTRDRDAEPETGVRVRVRLKTLD
jgi:lipopolysaccharide assembly outer membrane protein LptD (OstA)